MDEAVVRKLRARSSSDSSSSLFTVSLYLVGSRVRRERTTSLSASMRTRWVGFKAVTTWDGSPGQKPSGVLMKRWVSTKRTVFFIADIFRAAIL